MSHEQYLNLASSLYYMMAHKGGNVSQHGKMEEEQLIAVQVVFSHGDRVPLGSYVNDPHQEAMKKIGPFGELTKEGKQSQYQLGQWLRERYGKLLPRKYSPKDVFVVSSDLDRCINSACCNLCGLYPPIGEDIWNKSIKWQPIPVHVDDVMMSPMPHMDVMMLMPGIGDHFKSKLEKYKPLLEYLTEQSGQPVTDLWEALMFRDIFTTQQKSGLRLPKWTKDIFPTQLNNLTKSIFSIGGKTKDMGRYVVGPILHSIVKRFDSVDRKLVMYSGHDLTISTMVNVLVHNYKSFTPECSSCLLFELVERKSQRYVKCVLKRNNDLDALFDMEMSEFVQLAEMFSITVEEKQSMFDHLIPKKADPAQGEDSDDLTMGATDQMTKSDQCAN